MFNIAICDDNEMQNEITTQMLLRYGEESRKVIDITAYASGSELLKDMEKAKDFDLYILDMIMPERSGIDVAKALRRMGIKSKIVFLTASSNLALEAYEVKAYNYIVKPLEYEKLKDILDDILDEIYGDDVDTVEVKTKNGNKRIEISQLLFVDIINRAPCYHFVDGTTLEGPALRGSFKSVVEQIMETERFAFCGAGMIVNLKQIDTITRGEVVMKNGATFYTPASAFKNLYDNWKVFWENN